MSIQQLYQNTIKQHAQSPVGFNSKFPMTHQADGYNPSCGDELQLYWQLDEPSEVMTNTFIKHIGFTADACIICKASCSLLCAHNQHKTLAQVHNDTQHVINALTQHHTLSITSLQALQGVSDYPSRINCALLGWQTLQQLLSQILAPNTSLNFLAVEK